jgi:hypothetical protein
LLLNQKAFFDLSAVNASFQNLLELRQGLLGAVKSTKEAFIDTEVKSVKFLSSLYGHSILVLKILQFIYLIVGNMFTHNLSQIDTLNTLVVFIGCKIICKTIIF